YALGRPTSNVLFWAVTIIDSPREMKDVRLAIGSNSASIWWLNGEEGTSVFVERQTVIDDAVSNRITLKKGRNVLRAAIIKGGGAVDFCARFLDANAEPELDIVALTESHARAGRDDRRRRVQAVDGEARGRLVAGHELVGLLRRDH